HSPSGRCGLCVVEIDDGQISLSCLMMVKNGMKIKTESYALDKIRKTNMQRLLNYHAPDCFRCFKSGSCKLQQYIFRFFDGFFDEATLETSSVKPYSFVKLLDDMIFDREKCISCGRCMKFLQETCGMRGRGVDLVDYSAVDKDDISGNIIDICPTAALKYNNNVWKTPWPKLKVVNTYDVSSVFMPKIQANVVDNKVLDISSVNGQWITNDIRFSAKNIPSTAVNDEKYFNHVFERLVDDIPSYTMDKKVFLIGDVIDIETLFMIKYVVDHNQSCVMVFDDSSVPRGLVQDIGLFNKTISSVDCAVFVGCEKTSVRYYIKNSINNLGACFTVEKITDIPDLQQYKSPHVFVSSNVFPCDFEQLENKSFRFSIIPKESSNLMLRYIDNYMPAGEFVKNHNRHDVEFLCVVGKSSY
ncbi:MAG: hypothetical protein EOM76_12300, partial [Sphingobacteriia bacterium]|nr:hypothetical protein [Sphingobacteriia bacterium]